MPSILSNPMPQQENERNIPDIMKSFAEKIMQTPNPEATFQQVLDSNPELKKLTNFLRPFYFADLRRNSMWFIFENDLKKQVIPTVFLHRELFIPTGFSASQRSTNRCLAWCR